MLVALLALYLTGGGDHSFLLGRIDTILDNVKIEVQSEERRTQAVRIVKAMDQDTKNFVERQKDRLQGLEKLNAASDLDTAAADAIWDARLKDVESYHALMLSHRQDLKSVVNRNEWARVFAR